MIYNLSSLHDYHVISCVCSVNCTVRLITVQHSQFMFVSAQFEVQESMGVLLGGVAKHFCPKHLFERKLVLQMSMVLCLFKHHKYSRMSGLVYVIFWQVATCTCHFLILYA